MTTNLLYAIGTLFAWTGGGLLLWSLLRPRTRFGSAGIGGLLLLLASLTPAFHGGPRIPLLWVVMPLSAWGCVAGVCLFALFVIRAFLDGSPAVGKSQLLAIGFAVLCGLAFSLEPSKQFELLRGSIALRAIDVAFLIAFSLAALGSMALLGRRGTVLARTAALGAGSVLFGLPLAWLLLTSFKEERDMASVNGLIWVPRVQRTVPYIDQEHPLLEGTYKGNWVQATIGARTAGGYLVEVQRPSSLRGVSFTGPVSAFRVVPMMAPVVEGKGFVGFVARELDDGRRLVQILEPESLRGQRKSVLPSEVEPVRDVGLRTQNYSEALEAMPPETNHGLVYLRNTLLLVVFNVVGTLLSSSLVAYGFARLWFPGRDAIFKVLLATMMLPGAVTLLPQFLLFRSFGWVDTLYPLWVPAFFASAFNVFLLRQFFLQIPGELEDAGKIDGAGALRIYWSIMLPQIGPALAVVAIWTFIGAWNNFMGPLIYINTPENMPIAYALQLFQTERGGAHGLMMAFATLTILPVLALFFFAQRYFVEGVALSGLGGR